MKATAGLSAALVVTVEEFAVPLKSRSSSRRLLFAVQIVIGLGSAKSVYVRHAKVDGAVWHQRLVLLQHSQLVVVVRWIVEPLEKSCRQVVPGQGQSDRVYSIHLRADHNSLDVGAAVGLSE